ncbi:MAG: serine O-acetyltransferase EpsC [Candidatus Diapherotrites archaeon]
MSQGHDAQKKNFLQLIWRDMKAVPANDPASRGVLDALICHHPLHAIIVHRLVHPLYTWRVPLLPRFIANFARFWSGVEIHPGAEIGESFFIDHGTGTVIGETTKIGKNCVVFQQVTLGGTGKHKGKRHPTLGDNVYVGVGSILLGPIKAGENAKIGANSFVLMHDIPANATVVGNPARIIRLDGKKVNLELPKTSDQQVEQENNGAQTSNVKPAETQTI